MNITDQPSRDDAQFLAQARGHRRRLVRSGEIVARQDWAARSGAAARG